MDNQNRTIVEYEYSGTFGEDDSTAEEAPAGYFDSKKSANRKTSPDVHEIEDDTDWEAEENIVEDENDDTSDVDPSDSPDDFAVLHSVIKHENKRFALLRQERGTRTEEDFEKLVERYDAIDQNRMKREARYEKFSTELLRDFLIRGHQTILPAPLEHTWWRDLLRGDFINIIHDCPHDIQEFVGNRNLYELLGALKDTQKEVLYYRTIRYWSNQRIAAMRGQTDRNILKTYETLIESLRYKLYMRLLPRYKAEEAQRAKDAATENGNASSASNERIKFTLSLNQREFMKENTEKYGEGKPKRVRRTKAEIEKAAIENNEEN